MKQTWTALRDMDPAFGAELDITHPKYQDGQWRRIVATLEQLPSVDEPFDVTQLQHAVQIAERAERAGASDEMILAALCHDMGKVVGYQYHGEIAAEMLRPYVSHDVCQVVRFHQDFEAYHCGHLEPSYLGHRDRHKGERWYELAIQFSEWDQASFDPSYAGKTLADYLPLVQQLCARPSGRWGSGPR